MCFAFEITKCEFGVLGAHRVRLSGDFTFLQPMKAERPPEDSCEASSTIS